MLIVTVTGQVVWRRGDAIGIHWVETRMLKLPTML
jgi:hypothetical protein